MTRPPNKSITAGIYETGVGRELRAYYGQDESNLVDSPLSRTGDTPLNTARRNCARSSHNDGASTRQPCGEMFLIGGAGSGPSRVSRQTWVDVRLLELDWADAPASHSTARRINRMGRTDPWKHCSSGGIETAHGRAHVSSPRI